MSLFQYHFACASEGGEGDSYFDHRSKLYWKKLDDRFPIMGKGMKNFVGDWFPIINRFLFPFITIHIKRDHAR